MSLSDKAGHHAAASHSTISKIADHMPERQSSRQGRLPLLYKNPTEATPFTHGWEMVFHTGSSKLYFPFRI